MPQAAGRAHLFDLIIPSVDLTHPNGPFFKGNESQIVSLAARGNKRGPRNGCQISAKVKLAPGARRRLTMLLRIEARKERGVNF